jgi:hypothetical protein
MRETSSKARLGLFLVSAGLLILTLVHPAWIEWATGLDPDHGSGVVEYLFVAACVVAAVFAGLPVIRRVLEAAA